MTALEDFCKRNDLQLVELPTGLFQVISKETHSLQEAELKRLGCHFMSKGRHNGREIITVDFRPEKPKPVSRAARGRGRR